MVHHQATFVCRAGAFMLLLLCFFAGICRLCRRRCRRLSLCSDRRRRFGTIRWRPMGIRRMPPLEDVSAWFGTEVGALKMSKK